MGKFISAAVLRDLAQQNKHVVLAEDAVLTPSAKDLVKELGITITQGNRQIASDGQVLRDQTTLCCSGPTPEPAGAGNEEELTKLVRRVVAETLHQANSGPRVVHAKASDLVLKPFEFGHPGLKMDLGDMITARDGSNLAAGVMTFDHSELPWHLTYDEIDYVIEGEFELRWHGQVFRAKAGDVISIPNGADVVFASPSWAKVFYVTYPANWADLVEK